MSRSNPQTNISNPSSRFMSWSGSKGVLKYYDKAAEEEKEIASKFTFLLLDSLACIQGWHEPSSSRIFSNEVRVIAEDPLTVKSFKGGVIAEGLYSEIKPRVKSAGGKFCANLYIAYKDGDVLKIGALSLTGAACGAWMDFYKANKKAVENGAVQIDGTKDGKKGSVKFKVPTFATMGVQPETNEQAVELDRKLQEYLNGYLSKKKSEQAKPSYEPDREYGDEDVPSDVPANDPGDDGLPF